MKRSLALCLLLSLTSPALVFAQETPAAPQAPTTPPAQTPPPALTKPLAQAAPAPQTSLEAQTTSEAQTIVSKQIAAIERDDAVEAYSYAAPQIQAMFPDPEVFLTMVAAHYAAIHRHRSVEFGPVEQQNDRMAEAVIFTDSDGGVWTALYKLEKQPEGGWKISGCVLAKSEEKAL
jgi:hypothetical protein